MKIKDNHYELGDRVKTKTDLFMLVRNEDEDTQEILAANLLCFTYGGCVILFDDYIHELGLMEVQKQV
jgi:hypothetical protein